MPVAQRVNWILIGRFEVFQPISDRVMKKALHVLKTKVDVSCFVAVTCVRLKQISNCLRHNQRCHPRKKTKTVNTDKTRPTLFTLLNKDRASEPVSETQDSQAQDNSQSDSEAAEKSCFTDSGQSGSKKVRIFQPNWMTLYSWLEYDSEHKFM